jgi:hypothetical protein
MIAAIQGGNVWQGITQGAITGAISGAMFYAAGSAITTMAIEGANGPAFVAAKVALHATAGAASGAVNAAISGGDIGQGAIIGGLSAGMAERFGGGIPQRMLIGSAMGGVSSAMAGGSFFDGAWQGAWTSAVAHVCNHMMHKITSVYLERAKQVLAKYHPEYYNDSSEVYFGEVDEGAIAQYDTFTKNIVVSHELSGELDYYGKRTLLEALAHEYQHTNDPFLQRANDAFRDTLNRYFKTDRFTSEHHWQIHRNALSLSREALTAMTGE